MVHLPLSCDTNLFFSKSRDWNGFIVHMVTWYGKDGFEPVIQENGTLFDIHLNKIYLIVNKMPIFNVIKWKILFCVRNKQN
jgi:hypothetical protein